MSDRLRHHTLGDIEVGTYMFYDVKVARIHINGTAYMTALDVGRALGYEEPRHVLKHMDELAAHEYIVIKHSNFKRLQRVLAESALTTFNKFAPSAILVTQSGAEKLAMVSRTVRGREFRNWLVDVVLPAYRAQAATSAPAPARPPTLAEQREARLMQKEIEAGLRAERMLQKAMAMAERERRLMEREEQKAAKLAEREEQKRARSDARLAERAEQKAARSDARLARATERMEREAAMRAIAMEQEKREAAKLILANSDQLAAAPGILPETIASLRIWAIEKMAGRSFPGILPAAPSEVVWDSDSDLALRFDMSEQHVGVIIEELGIKDNPDMFRIRLVKAPHSTKTVEMYEYSPAAVELMEAEIRDWMAKSRSK